MSDGNEVVGQEAWSELAEPYSQIAPTKDYNAYYDHPNIHTLLPDLQGKKLLDAGCGPGLYTEEFINRGAEVIAFDLHPKMIELAKKRLGDMIKIFRHDITKPLDFAEDNTFDYVAAPLVLDYIKDWSYTFTEFFRVLKPGGQFVFSCGHPAWYLRNQHIDFEDYFKVEVYEMTWGGFGKKVTVPSFKRPLQEMTDPLFHAGFLIDRIVENRPTEQMKIKTPETYEKLHKEPGFITIRALKPI